MRQMETCNRTTIAKACTLQTVSLKRLLPWITASTVSGMTVTEVNRSVKASATISMVVGLRSLLLR